MPDAAIVCDTTLLLYLDRIKQIDLLPALYSTVYVPDEVVLELNVGRQMRRDTIDPRECIWAKPIPVSQALIDDLPQNRLGAGEQAVIAYANAHRTLAAGLDDMQARQFAEELGLAVAGTLGILLRAKQVALVPTVRPLLDALSVHGFHLAPSLYQDVLTLAGEATTP